MKLTVGVPGVATLEVPVRPGFLQSIRRVPWFRRVMPAGARMSIHVAHDDDGYVDLRIGIANFWSRPIVAESVQISESIVGNAFVNFSDAKLKKRIAIPSQSVAEVEIQAKIDAAGVRGLQNGIGGPARNRYSSPVARSSVRGWLDLSSGSSRQSLEFSIGEIAPFLNLYNPSSESE